MQTFLLIVAATAAFFYGIVNNQVNPLKVSQNYEGEKMKMLKDVGEPYMDHFGLAEDDFQNIKGAGVDIIESNFDICASTRDITYFLDMAGKYGLKVIMPAGSGEAEWGYACGQENFPITQQPVWQRDLVQKWVKTWKSRPEIYAWDISNEAGSVFPNARILNDKNSLIPDVLYIDRDQLKVAYNDVKSADPARPILIRMNGWFYYDNDKDFFKAGNPFQSGVADIVMVNAYSNVSDYYADFVPTVTKRASKAIKEISPNTKIIIALGAWQERPLWYMPTEEHLETEINYLKKQDVLGIAYFKYGAKGSEWYLPDSGIGAPKLWEVIKSN